MLISNIINDGIGLFSKQLRFYCWHFRRDLDQKQRQELIQLLYEQHFDRLANKIKLLNSNSSSGCKQQITKLLFEHCLTSNRRSQLIQLIESKLIDINVRLDNYGRTLLHRSAYNLDVELVRLLIASNVNLRLRDYAGNTALHVAIQSYRNGSVIYGDGPDVVQNLTSIISMLLEADQNLQKERSKRKRIKLSLENQRDLSNSKNSYEPQTSYSNQSQNGPFELSQKLEKDDNNNQSIDITDMNLQLHLTTQKSHSTRGSRNKNINQAEPSSSLSRLSSTSKTSHESTTKQSDEAIEPLNCMLLEDVSSSLVDTKNAFGRTALHYCVLVVGQQHLAHFVHLLISYGADTDAIDTRMKTPLYCLVKRPGITALKQKVLAISNLLESGCDDLGLAIDAKSISSDEKLIKELEAMQPSSIMSNPESPPELIFTRTTFKRVPSLMHIARLRLIRLFDESVKLRRQTKLSLPNWSPSCLNLYVNRRILDQSELF